MKKSKGRMINKSISDSDGFARLSPEAATLFQMLIPHYNAHGKMPGGPAYIKEIVCPKVPYLTIESIPGLLRDISRNTNVKYFEFGGRFWIHSLNFLSKHQELRESRMGPDDMPNFNSGTTPGVIPLEVEVEVEVEGKEEDIYAQEKNVGVRDLTSNTDVDINPQTGEVSGLSKEKLPKNKKSKTDMPVDFCVSEYVKQWAKKKGHDKLDEHLESFKCKVAANGYKYVDWDAAFMNAIRDNWARISSNGNGSHGKTVFKSTVGLSASGQVLKVLK